MNSNWKPTETWVVVFMAVVILVLSAMLISGCNRPWYDQARIGLKAADTAAIAAGDAGRRYYVDKCTKVAHKCEVVPCPNLESCKKEYYVFSESIIGVLVASGAADRSIEIAKDAKGKGLRAIAEGAVAEVYELFHLLSTTYARFFQ